MAIKKTENSLGAGAGGGSTSNLGNSKSSTEKQSAVIYDMLSEGPIQGLVNGAASIYLDGTAVMEGGNNKSFGAGHSTNVSYTASTGVIVDNNGSLFSSKDVTEGTFYIKIHKAGKAATVSTTAGLNIITATSNVFSTTDVTSFGGGLSIHIPGAGVEGNDYIGTISRFISATQVQVFNPPSTTTSGKAAKVDLISSIGTIQSSAQATLSSTGLGINASNVTAFVQTPTQSGTSTPKYNFENTAVAFRTGTRDQSYLKPPVGLGSSAIIHNASSELEQTDLSGLSGIGSTPNAIAGWDDAGEPTATRTVNRVTAATMGVTNPGEVDQISISINFPSGVFAHKPKSGSEGPAQAEFLIDFDYSKDGSTFTTTRIFGRSDAQLSAAGSNMGKPNVNQGGNGMVRAHTRTPFTKTFSFDIEKFQPFVDYRVNVQRVNIAQGESGGFNHTSTAQLQAIQNIIEDKLSYPFTAYGAVIVDAQNFSGLPVRGYELRGLKVKVPTNYHPRHEISEGSAASYDRHITNGSVQSSAQDWDGNFRGDLHTFTTGVNVDTVYTDNPVWVLFDIMTNDRYGLGKFIDPQGDFAMIDKFQLYQIAKYCDELVPDGKGGQEPRFTCNMYITELAEAQRYLSDLIGIFRGMLVYFNGKIAPQVNRKKSSIYTFTKSNVLDGSFTYQSASKRFRSNQIRVTWNNPESFYRQDVEVVEDIENILETSRITPNEVVAMGCTSQGQAHRFGKWILLTEKMSTEVVSFGTGLNAGHLKPGDLIEVQDSDIYTTQSAGRVDSAASSTTTVVRLDRAVDLSASGTNFELNLVYPTGGAYLAEDYAVIGGVTYERGDLILSITSQTAAANAEDASGNSIQVAWSEYSRIETQPIASYTSSVITVSTAFSAVPNAEVMWSITATTQATGKAVASAPRPFQIASIQEDSNQKTYSITATEYSDNLYDLVERGYVIEQVPDIRKPPVRTDIIPVPTGLGLSGVTSGAESQSEDVDANTTGLDLLIGWIPPVSEVTGSTTKYEHIGGYELKIIGLEEEEGKSEKVIKLGPNNTGHRIKGVRPGVVITVFLRLVTTTGFFSAYIKDEIELVASKLPINSVPKISSIMKGGSINQTITIAANGNVSVGSQTYQLDSPDGVTYNNNSGTTSTYQQAFNGMGASAIAYLLFDASESGDRFKAVQFVENNTAVNALGDKLAIKYWKEVGASNEGTTATSGTVSMAANSNLITGSSTSFTSEYSVGDKIFVGSGTSLFMASINAISNDTTIRVNDTTTRAYSGVAVKKQSFEPTGGDLILGKIVTDSSTTYSISELYAVTKGITGGDGLNNAIITLYQVSNSTSSPTLPSGNATYTFSNATLGSFASNANGWSQTISSVTSSNKYLWVTQASASSSSPTVVVADSGWAAGKILSTFGNDGAAGPRTTVTRLNFGSSSASAPTAPTSSNTNTFDFSDANFDNILSGWSHSTPTYASGNSNKYWYIDVTVVESTFGGTQTLSFGSVTQAIGFSGLVTFSNSSTLTDGNTNFSPIIGSQVNANVTAISGGAITTGTISANRIDVSNIVIGNLSGAGSFKGGLSNLNNPSSSITPTDDTVANTKITGGQVNANVTAISGGAITTGTISANRIDVGSIVIGNLSGAGSFKGGLSNLNNPSSAITPISGGQVNANVTSISGGAITTGTVAANRIAVGSIVIGNLSGAGSFKGGLSNLNNPSSAITPTDDTVANTKTTAAAAATAANNANKTAGTVGAWTIDGNKISNSKIEIDNANERILIKDS